MTGQAAADPRTCAASGCGVALVRRKDERNHQWTKRRFCSVACRNRTIVRQDRRLVDLVCRWCEKPYSVPPSQARISRYCSRKCHNKGREKWRPCEGCGTRYQPHRTGGERFCGIACRAGARSVGAGEPRRCAATACGEPLVRRDSERPAGFRRRRYCDASCAYAARRTPTRSCAAPGCGKTIPHGATEAMYCSRDCYNRRTEFPAKRCAVCPDALVRRPGERCEHFRRRVTCSAECRRIHQRQLCYRDVPRQGAYPTPFAREIAPAVRERDGHQCRLCGATRGRRNLPVHHIDYNRSNVAGDNLITLCDPCHNRTNVNRGYWQAALSVLMLNDDAA